jgi:AcrR family transcriptional regulator
MGYYRRQSSGSDYTIRSQSSVCQPRGRNFVGPTSIAGGGCDGSSAGSTRPLRADALRNRARILEAAEVVFAAEGIEAQVDTIAEKAGVGVGTLYRHFPTKEKLCEAILLERLSQLTLDAQALAEAEDPTSAFFGFLEHVVEEGAAKRDLLVAVMGANLEFEVAATDVKEGLHDALGILLRRAQSVGAVRPDVTAHMVMSLVGATCQAAAHATAAPACDLLAIICDGLRPQSAGG